jgi:rare lipoprotein A
MNNTRPTPCLAYAESSRLGRNALALGVLLALTLAGCANVNTKSTDAGAKTSLPPFKGGGYYKDDGPGANPPGNLDAIPDAIPKDEPFNRNTSKAYKVLGKRYVPLADNAEYKARGLASWYGRKFHGNATSIGEPYDMYAMSAAHPTLPLPSYARVTNLENGKSVVVRVNDRGPFHPGRIIDLSYTAAHKLDILKGVTRVEVESVLADAAPTSFVALAEQKLTPDLPPPAASVEAEPMQPAFYLQLGAFTNPVTADSVLAQATAKLSSGFPSVMRLEQNGMFKIQAGPFASAETADLAAAEILQDLGIKTFKIAVPPTPANSPAAANLVATTETPIAPSATVQASVTQTESPSPLVVSPPASNATAATPGLYLQLAALSSPAAAEALASRVKNRFGNELPGLDQINTGALYKLQAGPFASQAAADQVALAYQQDFGIRPYRVNR